jgi:pyrroloquinoline-quinone synthase
MNAIRPRLLDHPFYQAWAKGEISAERLGNYHSSYTDLIQRVPVWWRTITQAFDANSPVARSIIQEEEAHIELWAKWGHDLPRTDVRIPLDHVILSIDSLSPSGLLGALHAFECQQPEVASSKKQGLLKYYGFAAADLCYFDEHENEHHHIRFGERLARRAVRPEFDAGVKTGAQLFYGSLDAFAAE